MQIVIFSDTFMTGYGKYAGPYRVATELRDHGYSVQVIELFCRLTFDEFKFCVDKYVGKDTLFVGISCTFMLGQGSTTKKQRNDILRRDYTSVDQKPDQWTTANALDVKQIGTTEVRSGPYGLFGREDIFECWDYIKKRNPSTQIVVGGARANEAAGDLYNNYIDFICTQQSDTSIVKLADHIKNGTPIDFKSTSGKAKILDVSKYPVDDFPKKRIRYEDQDLIFYGEDLTIEIARGCIFKCAYCSYPLLNKKWYEFNRDPLSVHDEIMYNHDRFGTTGYMISDETLNDSTEKIQGLHKELSCIPFDMHNSCFMRADLVVHRPWTAELIAEMGVKSIFFGIETLNRDAGKSIGKGMDPERIKEGLYKMKEVPGWDKININMALIIGLPYETEESIMKTYDWLCEPDCPVDTITSQALRIMPGTMMGINPKKYGYEWGNDGKWRSPWMTETLAEEIGNELMNGDRWAHKRGIQRINGFHYNRIRNLGFDIDEEMRSNKYGFDEVYGYADRIRDRFHKKKSEYLEMLFNHDPDDFVVR